MLDCMLLLSSETKVGIHGFSKKHLKMSFFLDRFVVFCAADQANSAKERQPSFDLLALFVPEFVFLS